MAAYSPQTYSNWWFQYLSDTRDPDLAVQVLTTPHQPLKTIFDFNRSYSNMEKGRFKAEEEFFRDRSPAVENLLAAIVRQRYCAPGSRPVELTVASSRQFISAARLFHERLIILSGAQHGNQYAPPTCIGLPIISQIGTRGPLYGPSESYIIGSESGEQEVRCRHRAAPFSVRLGNCFVEGLGSYVEIRDKLDQIMWKLGNYGQMRLADIFLHFTRTHQIIGVPELDPYEMFDLAKICFLILEVEQSQWQSALFFRGDSWANWKLGLSVSFARLLRLFRDGHISLDELFFEYPLYSTKYMMVKFLEVRRTCQWIDDLFRSVYGGTLGKQRAMDDLKFLYGDC